MRDSAGDRWEALCPVVAVAGAYRRLTGADVSRHASSVLRSLGEGLRGCFGMKVDAAVAVPLDLVDPERSYWRLVDEDRQTPLDPLPDRLVEEAGLSRIALLRDQDIAGNPLGCSL